MILTVIQEEETTRVSVQVKGELLASYRNSFQAFQHAYCALLLERTRGNITTAARLARMPRKSFFNVVQRSGIDLEHYRQKEK